MGLELKKIVHNRGKPAKNTTENKENISSEEWLKKAIFLTKENVNVQLISAYPGKSFANRQLSEN